MNITIVVHPHAKQVKIEKDNQGVLHVYVREVPAEGKANTAVIKAIAEYFNVAKSCVDIVKGGKSKQKTVSILK